MPKVEGGRGGETYDSVEHQAMAFSPETDSLAQSPHLSRRW